MICYISKLFPSDLIILIDSFKFSSIQHDVPFVNYVPIQSKMAALSHQKTCYRYVCPLDQYVVVSQFMLQTVKSVYVSGTFFFHSRDMTGIVMNNEYRFIPKKPSFIIIYVAVAFKFLTLITPR